MMVGLKVPAEYKTALGRDKRVKSAGGGLTLILLPDEYVPLMSAARRADNMYHIMDEAVQLAGCYDIDLPPKFEEALEVYSSVYVQVATALERHEEIEMEGEKDEG